MLASFPAGSLDHLPGGLLAIHTGHLHIQQDNAERVPGTIGGSQHFQRFGAAGRCFNSAAKTLDHAS